MLAVIARGARKVTWVSARAVSAIHAEQKKRGWADGHMAMALGIARQHWVAARAARRNLPFVAICKAFRLGVSASALLHINGHHR